MKSETQCRLYLVTPPKLDPSLFAETLKHALDGGDVASLQLRLKQVSDDEILRASEILMPVTRSADVAFILNDRPDLAAKMGADGVHIGQEDGSYEEARTVMGTDHIVGVTCHNSRHLAIEAADKGADYVAFGAFFSTQTKEPKTFADVALLRWWADTMVVPSVAIGGITLENAESLIAASADFLAVSASVWNHAQGPAAAIKAFQHLLSRALDAR
jgi:thiamine-phosphate pyrophosphorylase